VEQTRLSSFYLKQQIAHGLGGLSGVARIVNGVEVVSLNVVRD
jgi:hypothetical protein